MNTKTQNKLDYLQETKSLIKAALNEKGIAISDSDTFRSYADSIRNAELKSDDVRYVTFMNGEVTLYVKPVATGDDCVNVLTKGLITTPKKESTVDKVFTYAGWAATDGGEVNANVLKAVTENKSVYAAYTEAVRYYTITYYDSDGTTVLKTESLAYGSTPAYTPAKDGFNFEGWTPSLATVKGNASYTATWSEKLSFAGASWADIARISEAGEAADYFKVGDTKLVQLTNGETMKVVIAGFDHDTLADGTGKARMSVICTGLPNITTQWAESFSSSYSYYYSGARCSVRKALLRDGIIGSVIPDELYAVIKPVIKKSDNGINSGTTHPTVESTETLWAASIDELGGTQPDNFPQYYAKLGEKYALFANSAGAIYKGTTTTKAEAWTRSLAKRSAYAPCRWNYTSNQWRASDTSLSSSNITSFVLPVVFGFCI